MLLPSHDACATQTDAHDAPEGARKPRRRPPSPSGPSVGPLLSDATRVLEVMAQMCSDGYRAEQEQLTRKVASRCTG